MSDGLLQKTATALRELSGEATAAEERIADILGSRSEAW